MVALELEELMWIAIHGRGVINTAHASQIAGALSQAGVVTGREAYYYMRYDDSPERVQMPFMYYAVLGRPNVKVILPEEVEPVGRIFDAIAVLDSSMLVNTTSQRALYLDGAKKHAALVVNSSLKSDDILGLVKKYNCAQDWEGSIATVRARKYHPNLAFGMIGAIAKAVESQIKLSGVIDALEALEYREDAIEAVKLAYEETEPVVVDVRAEECAPYRRKAKLVEEYKNLPVLSPLPWDREAYMGLKRRASEAPNYELRFGSMPRWEILAPGLIEYNNKPSERNMGFKTSMSRTFRPVIDKKACIDCKLCHIFCPDGAIDFDTIEVDYDYCTGCGICGGVCGPNAISMVHELKALESLDEEEVLTIREALIEYAY